MFSKVNSAGLQGIEGYLVQVEADAGDGLPGFSMVGYLAAEVREAEDRVRTAIKNSGFHLIPMKVTLNLSPANIRKDGTALDLSIALAVLGAYGLLDFSEFCDCAFIGELGLDGTVKGITGVLPFVLALQDCGIRRFFLPEENVEEGLAVENAEIVKITSLRQLYDLLKKPERIKCEERSPEKKNIDFSGYAVDFSEINGQAAVRRATEIAVAGWHNILFLGPPGSGKSMIAQRIPTIMPELSFEEQIELSKIYSVCGKLSPNHALMKIRPFRSPHHTISPQAFSGGGKVPRPGELSLASRGVLFLDELPEFQRATLEVLRQPLEERHITISRMWGSYRFPADFMLAAAMNPCPCGYYPDRSKCMCNDLQVKRYLNRVSRALLDRIDLCVESSTVSYQELRETQENESSETIRKRVRKAQQIQKKRFEGTGRLFNSEMNSSEVKQYCALGKKEEALLKKMFEKLQLSARGYHRILKVARTIADLSDSEDIQKEHLLEAAGYRSLEERYWGRG